MKTLLFLKSGFGFLYNFFSSIFKNIKQYHILYFFLFGLLYYLQTNFLYIDYYNNSCYELLNGKSWYCDIVKSVELFILIPEIIIYGLIIFNIIALYIGNNKKGIKFKEIGFLFIIIPYLLLRIITYKESDNFILNYFNEYYYIIGEYGLILMIVGFVIYIGYVNNGLKINLPKISLPTIEPVKTLFGKGMFNLSLLKESIKIESIDTSKINKNGLKIKETLAQFKIDVTLSGYKIGPTVIQYRLKPKEGVKLQRIETLKKDLALSLQAESIRIQAPIPGLGVVGIEIPNPKRETVFMKDILTSSVFNNKNNDLPFALGKDVNGEIVVGDLTKMPHLLVAGQTGSGKSVGMNGFLVSMLYRFSPSELKMIMVDPKMVELSIYNGIPHLLTPVITNPDKALNALKWCVAEMLRRYDLATKVNARNLKEFNEKVSKEEKLPYIVMVIDELADLMMSGNKKEVEQSIARIAQMARAVGIHLIIATQRPSVDIITGLIKANIPSRIAFTVASQIDSRTILDKGGAEDLLGRGDMLYHPTGAIGAERIQGLFISTGEIESIVNELKLKVEGNFSYTDGIVEGNYDENDESPLSKTVIKEDNEFISILEEQIDNGMININKKSKNYLIIKTLINNGGYNSRRSFTLDLNIYGITHNSIVKFIRLIKDMELVTYNSERKINELKKDLTIDEVINLYEKMDNEI